MDLAISEPSGQEWQKQQPSPQQVMSVLAALLASHYVNTNQLIQHAMTTLLKFAGEFAEVCTSSSSLRRSCSFFLSILVNPSRSSCQPVSPFSTLSNHGREG